MRFLITGVAGFIGHAVAKKLARQGHQIIGIDNLNDYYDVSLKKARLENLSSCSDVVFFHLDLANRNGIAGLFDKYSFDRVIHLAAQAGVRYSLENPHVYADSNLVGHLNILEGCRHQRVKHLIYASSSSVYGMNTKFPFSVKDRVDHPISLYAATKKANELMSYSYSHLYNLPITGLRFFTVYGPWGRPDMAMFKFTKSILEGRSIDVYNRGEMSRDFTYIDDIVEGVVRVTDIVPTYKNSQQAVKYKDDISDVPHALYNIGHGSPMNLMEFIHAVEKATGKQAICNYLPMQPGDVKRTWADTEDLYLATGYQPRVDVENGVCRFVEWFRNYYHI